jgi:ankyrin repeat protein
VSAIPSLEPDQVPEQVDPVDEVLRLGCLTYGDDSPERRARGAALLATLSPERRAASVPLAAALADVEALERALAADPDAASRPGGPFGWPPLLHLAYGRLEPAPDETSTLTAARLLLDHGADPGAAYLWHGHAPAFTALTGCFGEGEGGPGDQPAHPHGEALARLLLEAGASPDDEQTLYNRMFRPDDRHLELLLEHGLDLTRLGGQLVWAAVHGYEDRIRLLARAGVDLHAEVGTWGGLRGRPRDLALLAGEPGAAALLAEPGRHVEPALATVAAVLAGGPVDEEHVAAAIALRPGLVAWAAQRGDAEAVRRAAGLGWDVDRLARTDVPSDEPWESALHVAAGNGDLATLRVLLELGADTDVRDRRFGGTPADWAAHFGQGEAADLLAQAGHTPRPPG